MPEKPLLLIVNGLPGAGKTTLARRLSSDLRLPVFSRDAFYEQLCDALADSTQPVSPSTGSAAFSLLYYVAGTILGSGHSLIVEGFFGRTDLRSAEFQQLRSICDVTIVQILCQADGELLLQRFLARVASPERHGAHADLVWLEENRARLLRGELAPLTCSDQLLVVDTATLDDGAYATLLARVRAALGVFLE